MCSIDNCKNFCVFGFSANIPTRCSKHKICGMFDARNTVCTHDDCECKAMYGYSFLKATSCENHIKFNMVNSYTLYNGNNTYSNIAKINLCKNEKCCTEKCKKNGVYYDKLLNPEMAKKYCSEHKSDKMIINYRKSTIENKNFTRKRETTLDLDSFNFTTEFDNTDIKSVKSKLKVQEKVPKHKRSKLNTDINFEWTQDEIDFMTVIDWTKIDDSIIL
jgi:hypothetical protein